MAEKPRIVHVMRHGQVHNPDGVLYGRLDGFGLSTLGDEMAALLSTKWADVPLTHLRCSPLQRAQETMAPTAARFPDLEVVTDERVIEAAMSTKRPTVLCTHRPTLPAVYEALGISGPVLAAGQALVIRHRKGSVLASELV